MEAPLLRDPDIFPANEVLKEILADSYTVYEELIEAVKSPGYELTPGWNYYKDGKAWLCKVSFKKKTIFWLSVWDKYFKTTFYFTDKNKAGISDLDIGKDIKDSFYSGRYFGKFLALTISFNRIEQINDFLKIVSYKKSLK